MEAPLLWEDGRPTSEVTRYIDAHKEKYGFEPICRVLEIAPSTYYAAANRLPCACQVRDQAVKLEIARVHEDNFGVYGPQGLAPAQPGGLRGWPRPSAAADAAAAGRCPLHESEADHVPGRDQ